MSTVLLWLRSLLFEARILIAELAQWSSDGIGRFSQSATTALRQVLSSIGAIGLPDEM